MWNKRGLTLIELIAVVIILGILLAIGIPQYRRAMERGKGAEAYSVLSNIQVAENLYRTEFDEFTGNFIRLGVIVAGATVFDANTRVTRYWNYVINGVGTDAYTATATKVKAPCKDDFLQVVHTSTTTTIDRDWEDCVNSL